MMTRDNPIKKKKIFFHIGAAKTASSTIQAFLHQNREELIKHNIFFPVVEASEYYNKRPWANARPLYHCLASIETFEENKKDFWQKAYLKPFQESNADTLLLTDELFCFSPASLFDSIDLSDFDVKIIAYIRPSVEYLCSAWSQACRSSFYKNLNGKISLQEFLHQDYTLTDIFETYIERFGKDNFILRPLEKEQLHGGSIHSDILHCLGIEINDSFIIDADRQLSINRNLAELLCLINKIDLPLDKHKEIKAPLLQDFSLEPKIIDTISDDVIREITDKNREKENRLAQLALNRDTLFINPYPKTYGKERPAYTHVMWSLAELGALQQAFKEKLSMQIRFESLKVKIKSKISDIPIARKAYRFLKGRVRKSS